MLVPVIVASVVGAMLTTAPAGAVPTCRGRVATIVGTPRSDRLVGTPHRDVIVGGRGDDRIIGAGGNDVLCGARGSDLLDGGRGDDTLSGGRDRLEASREVYTVGDRLRGGPGADHFDGGRDWRPADYRIPDRIILASATRGIVFDSPAGTITGEGKDTVTQQPWAVSGSTFDDRMTGGPGGDWLDGRRGDDYLLGGRGGDVLLDDARRGAGNDILEGGAGRDSLQAGRGRDVLRGGAGTDSLSSDRPTADQLYGGPGDDNLDDFLVGSVFQHIDGGAGFNDISVALPETPDAAIPDYRGTVDMTTGLASLTVNAQVVPFVLAHASRLGIAYGRWRVTGTDGDDEILAWGTARLYVSALAGNDSVQGGPRNDNLAGGSGQDDVWPGKGVDTCVEFELERQPCELP